MVVAAHLLDAVARLLQAPPQGSEELAGVGEGDDPLVAQVLEAVEQRVDLAALGVLVEGDDLLQSAGLRGEVHDDGLGESGLLEAGVEDDWEVDGDGVVVEPGDRLVPPLLVDALLVPGHGCGDPADVDVGQVGQRLLAGDRHPARRRGPNPSRLLLLAVELPVPGVGERVVLRLEEEVREAGEGCVALGPQELQGPEDVDGQVARRCGRQGQPPPGPDAAQNLGVEGLGVAGPVDLVGDEDVEEGSAEGVGVGCGDHPPPLVLLLALVAGGHEGPADEEDPLLLPVPQGFEVRLPVRPPGGAFAQLQIPDLPDVPSPAVDGVKRSDDENAGILRLLGIVLEGRSCAGE